MTLEGAVPYPRELVEKYYKNHWWLGITLGEMLDRTCDLHPHKEALVAGDVRLTYRQLRELTDRAAIAFLELGIGKTGPRSPTDPDWPEFVYAYFGLTRSGQSHDVHSSILSREMDHFREITEARAWIVPRRL